VTSFVGSSLTAVPALGTLSSPELRIFDPIPTASALMGTLPTASLDLTDSAAPLLRDSQTSETSNTSEALPAGSAVGGNQQLPASPFAQVLGPCFRGPRFLRNQRRLGLCFPERRSVMFDRVGDLAEKLATNVSRRTFLGRLGQGALGLAAVIGGVLVFPAPGRADNSKQLCCLLGGIDHVCIFRVGQGTKDCPGSGAPPVPCESYSGFPHC
jgi:hypothetical protein